MGEKEQFKPGSADLRLFFYRKLIKEGLTSVIQLTFDQECHELNKKSHQARFFIITEENGRKRLVKVYSYDNSVLQYKSDPQARNQVLFREYASNNKLVPTVNCELVLVRIPKSSEVMMALAMDFLEKENFINVADLTADDLKKLAGSVADYHFGNDRQPVDTQVLDKIRQAWVEQEFIDIRKINLSSEDLVATHIIETRINDFINSHLKYLTAVAEFLDVQYGHSDMHHGNLVKVEGILGFLDPAPREEWARVISLSDAVFFPVALELDGYEEEASIFWTEYLNQFEDYHPEVNFHDETVQIGMKAIILLAKFYRTIVRWRVSFYQNDEVLRKKARQKLEELVLQMGQMEMDRAFAGKWQELVKTQDREGENEPEDQQGEARPIAVASLDHSIEKWLAGEHSDHNLAHSGRVLDLMKLMLTTTYTVEEAYEIMSYRTELAEAAMAHDAYQHLDGEKSNHHGEMQTLVEILKFMHRYPKGEAPEAERKHLFTLITIIANHSYANDHINHFDDLQQAWSFLATHVGVRYSFERRAKDITEEFITEYPLLAEFKTEIMNLHLNGAMIKNPFDEQDQFNLEQAVHLFYAADKLDPYPNAGGEDIFAVLRMLKTIGDRRPFHQRVNYVETHEEELELLIGREGKAGGQENLGISDVGRAIYQAFRFVGHLEDQTKAADLGETELVHALIQVDHSIRFLQAVQEVGNALDNWDYSSEGVYAVPSEIDEIYKLRRQKIDKACQDCALVNQYVGGQLLGERIVISQVLKQKKKTLGISDHRDEILNLALKKLQEIRKLLSENASNKVKKKVDNFWEGMGRQKLDVAGIIAPGVIGSINEFIAVAYAD